MPRVLTYDGTTCIGAYKFPDRKKPCLCVQEGSSIVVYGTFNNDEAANNFMKKLGEFVGAYFEKESEDTE
jgi:hypothetical protein